MILRFVNASSPFRPLFVRMFARVLVRLASLSTSGIADSTLEGGATMTSAKYHADSTCANYPRAVAMNSYATPKCPIGCFALSLVFVFRGNTRPKTSMQRVH